MKLVFYDMNIRWEIAEGINSLVIESPEILEKTVIGFKGAQDGANSNIRIIDDADEEIDIKGFCDMICTPFDLTFNKREIQKKLYSDLQHIIENYYGEELAELQSQMMNFIDLSAASLDYNATTNDEADVKGLLKLFELHIEEPEGDFTDKLIDYILTIYRLLGKRIFIIVNCEVFLGERSYVFIKKIALYYGIYIVALTGRQIELIKNENTYIIDRDLCEIH